MKVRALKDLNLGGTGIVAVTFKKGDIFDIDDNQPEGFVIGSKGVVYYTQTGMIGAPVGTLKKLPLVLGQDVEIFTDNTGTNTKPIYDSDIKKEKMGSYMFVGGILLLTYIVYKIIKTK